MSMFFHFCNNIQKIVFVFVGRGLKVKITVKTVLILQWKNIIIKEKSSTILHNIVIFILFLFLLS